MELPSNGNYATHALHLDNQEPQILYSASGDNNAYAWDLNSGKIVGKFSGHVDYLHCITQRPNGQLVTGSEDGSIKLWDSKSQQLLNTINNAGFYSKTSEKWISCVGIDKSDNWLVCGGGSRCLVTWYLPAMTATAFIPTSGTPQALTFMPDDTILSVGNEQYVYQWEKSGKLMRRVNSNSRSLFSVIVNQPMEYRVIAVSGTSPLVDVYTSFGNISFSLQFTTQVHRENTQT